MSEDVDCFKYRCATDEGRNRASDTTTSDATITTHDYGAFFLVCFWFERKTRECAGGSVGNQVTARTQTVNSIIHRSNRCADIYVCKEITLDSKYNFDSNELVLVLVNKYKT